MDLIETSARQKYYGQKSGRLFFQAALGVDALDSVVLLPEAMAGASHHLSLLRAGSDANDIPCPVTETVADDYSHMLVRGLPLTSLISVNAGSIDATNTEVIEQVEELSNEFYNDAKHAIDLAVEQCEEAGLVEWVALQALAKQGALLQQMERCPRCKGCHRTQTRIRRRS